MSDRGILFLFRLLVIFGGVGCAAWLLASGQAATVDGLFLMLTSLLIAAAFLLYVIFMISRARQVEKAAAPAKTAAPAKSPVVAAQ